MAKRTLPKQRELAAIADLVAKAQEKGFSLGRTQLMKLLYLLESVRGLPLNYHFTLYTYGPFDSEVLEDLVYAESLEAIKSRIESHPKGYQYIITPGERISDVQASEEDFLKKYGNDFDWVITEFGSRTAADLEM